MTNRRRRHGAHSLKETPEPQTPSKAIDPAQTHRAEPASTAPPPPRPRMTHDEALEYMMSQRRASEPKLTDEELAERQWQYENRNRVLIGRSNGVVSQIIHLCAIISIFVAMYDRLPAEARHIASGMAIGWVITLWLADRLKQPKVRPNAKVIAIYAMSTIIGMALFSLLVHGIG